MEDSDIRVFVGRATAIRAATPWNCPSIPARARDVSLLQSFQDNCLVHEASCSMGRGQLKRDSTRWRTGGEVKGKLANGVASTLHTTSEHGVSSITTADAHISAANSRLNWSPCRFKWTRPFRRKTKSGFCACAITFQTQSIKGLLLGVKRVSKRKTTTHIHPELGLLMIEVVTPLTISFHFMHRITLKGPIHPKLNCPI